jgi:hypothetical protein
MKAVYECFVCILSRRYECACADTCLRVYDLPAHLHFCADQHTPRIYTHLSFTDTSVYTNICSSTCACKSICLHKPTGSSTSVYLHLRMVRRIALFASIHGYTYLDMQVFHNTHNHTCSFHFFDIKACHACKNICQHHACICVFMHSTIYLL